MSSILLANPFVPHATPHQPPPADLQNSYVIAQTPGAGSTAGDAASDAGGGTSRQGGQSQQDTIGLIAARADRDRGRSQNATPTSVVNAQAQTDAASTTDAKARARRAAEALSRIPQPSGDRTGQASDAPYPFGSNLPKVPMPDPLPTSPYLKPSNPG